MRQTMFEIPAISVPMGWLCRAILKMRGWHFEGHVPDVTRCVIIVAPHTSNWDFPILMVFGFALGIHATFLGKDSIFRWPVLGRLFYGMGGIPVDRSQAHSLVAYAVRLFQQHDRLILGIAPEGTRKWVEAWKSGFYYIALGAQVPIAPVYLDYGRKAGGFGPMIYLTGDVPADMKRIEEVYRGVRAYHPEMAGPVSIKPREK